jgi:hypothetical protein
VRWGGGGGVVTLSGGESSARKPMPGEPRIMHDEVSGVNLNTLRPKSKHPTPYTLKLF